MIQGYVLNKLMANKIDFIKYQNLKALDYKIDMHFGKKTLRFYNPIGIYIA